MIIITRLEANVLVRDSFERWKEEQCGRISSQVLVGRACSTLVKCQICSLLFVCHLPRSLQLTSVVSFVGRVDSSFVLSDQEKISLSPLLIERSLETVETREREGLASSCFNPVVQSEQTRKLLLLHGQRVPDVEDDRE